MHPYHPFWSLEVPRVDGHLLFANWLNYYVYQLTSYRVEDIGKVFTYDQGGK